MRLTWKSMKEQIVKLGKELKVDLVVYKPTAIDLEYNTHLKTPDTAKVLLIPLKVGKKKTFTAIHSDFFKTGNNTYNFNAENVFIVLGACTATISAADKKKKTISVRDVLKNKNKGQVKL
jgi:hypothetical protein